ncbi:MAG: ribosome maturation factor RimM [Beijerinckiaceae bacterium]
MQRSSSALIAVGKIGAPHGVRGQVRVKSYTGNPMALGSYGALNLADGRRLSVSQLRPLKEDMLVASFESVVTREAVEALTGKEVFVPRSALPPPNEDEFYHADLIGLIARLAGGEIAGRVAAIHNFGAGDILEIAVTGGEVILLPFTKAAVPNIDFAAGCLTINPPHEVDASDESGAF